MPKQYLQKNVYESALGRYEFIFDEFDSLYFSFSGGKDSSVMMELALEAADEEDLPLDVMLIDLEGHYQKHIEYSLSVCDKPEINCYWICLPLALRNAVSQFQPKWICWNEDEKDYWIRDMPDRDYVINQHNMPEAWEDWFWKGMEFEEFIIYFADWMNRKNKAEKTGAVVAIRSDESLNRFRTIKMTDKTMYKDRSWTTQVQDCEEEVYNLYPIYDWKVKDVWSYIGKKDVRYNKIYDMMYKFGRSIHDMRICQPYGDDQREGLDLFHKCEPETWFRVVQRVSGANFGAKYKGKKILGNYDVNLPEGHTWKSYAKMLLQTMPPYLKDHYIKKINVFLKWHARDRGQDIEHMHKKSEDEEYDDMGLFIPEPEIPDEADKKKEAKKKAPSWRRIAKCIMKNDYMCKSLSFNQTQDEWKKLQDLKRRYEDL